MRVDPKARLISEGRAPAIVRLLVFVGALVLAWSLWTSPWKTVGVLLFVCVQLIVPLVALYPGIWTRRGKRLAPATTDLTRRRVAWRELSELYLDTELDRLDHQRIAAVLRELSYSSAQLEEILYRELHPVLLANLLSVAGEWGGFDPDWLEEEILQRSPARMSLAILPGKWMVQETWAAVEAELMRSKR